MMGHRDLRLINIRRLSSSIIDLAHSPPSVGRSRTTSEWNTHIRDCLARDSPYQALLLYRHMSRLGTKPDRVTFPVLLKASVALSSVQVGLAFQAQIAKSGFQHDTFVATALVDSLAKCGDQSSASKVFDEMAERDVAAWNALIAGYSRNGYVEKAMSMFAQMRSSGATPNSLTISILLQVCSSSVRFRKLGKCVHGYVYRQWGFGGKGVDSDVFLDNCLLVFYCKCGDVEAAERLFKRMPVRDLVSWNAMILGYGQNGSLRAALKAFCQLREEGFSPDSFTLEMALHACAQVGNAIDYGKLIHGFMIMSGYFPDVCVENSLLHMYSKCGDMESLHILFDRMLVRNLISWNILIDGYVKHGQPQKALSLFRCMRTIEIQVSSSLLVSALQVPKLLGGCPEEQVMCIHCLATTTGFDSDAFVISSLIAAYGECGNIDTACRCFNYFTHGRNVNQVCWNAMVSAYMHNQCFNEAMELLHIQFNECKGDTVTLVNVLQTCFQSLDLRIGKQVHGYIIRNWFDSSVIITTALLELYVRCGSLNTACRIFARMDQRNVVSWNTMIFGCCQNGFPRVSLNLFHHMRQQEIVIPDATTIVGVTNAICQRGIEQEGKYIHEYAVLVGLDSNEFVTNSLITMYVRFGDFNKVNLVFDKFDKLSLVTWNVLISECTHGGLSDKAIAAFHQMKAKNVAPDSITVLSLLSSCVDLASLSCGMWIHSIINKTGHESDVFVGTALVDMYAKCGDLSMARMVFERMSVKTTASWNSMICGYGMHGNANEADRIFSEMQQMGVNPDVITFLSLISACSHAGDVEKGRHYFDLMTGEYSLPPSAEHCASIVDLLSRNGLLNQAFEFLRKLPASAGSCAWGALLSACRVHGNVQVGLLAAEKLFELDPLHSGYHVLLANMLSEVGRWTEASKVRTNLIKMGVKKVPGWSIVDYHI